ncbi:myrosinase 1-like [Athalia rosae]|uniref:myrosinase 1-like n=1 Tax=Athalia rosae TaxID=37344 RepID=UPI00203447EA|nr:myrosinase 1-like [Athalia rosae]
MTRSLKGEIFRNMARCFWIITFISLICTKGSEGQASGLQRFPDGFLLGAASASYQVEGAWNVSGKGVSTWDHFAHTMPERIADGSNGDIACDSYNKYKEDVQWIKSIGLDHYRFSLSWTRILPNGFNTPVNQDGIRYYKSLLEELKAANITTVVSLYHWDHPQILEEMGGWTNELMVRWFVDYAKVVFDNIGHLIDIVITINEPKLLCQQAYNSTWKAPGKVFNDMGHFFCVHNILKAHAKTWHMYDQEYRATQNGMIGFTTPVRGWVQGEGVTEETIERAFQFDCGWIMSPIYTGDYPEVMKTRIAERSALQNYPFSRLPEFTDEWKKIIKGATDFFGLNHYTSSMPTFDPAEALGTFASDTNIIGIADPSWPSGASGWLHIVPEGIGNVLRKIKDTYGNPPVYMFENGVSDKGEIEDYVRINYYHDYISEILTAIVRDGCDVKAYTAWTLLDNYEWEAGYTERFGILKVDFDSPNRTRSEKLSTHWWREVLRTRTLIDAREFTSHLRQRRREGSTFEN